MTSSALGKILCQPAQKEFCFVRFKILNFSNSTNKGVTIITEVGMTIENNPLNWNKELGRLVSEVGRRIVLREVQPWKQLDPIAVTVVGTMMEERYLQERNAAAPMETTDTSTITVVIVVLSLNFVDRMVLPPVVEGNARIVDSAPHDVASRHGK